jgi:hypothetical protein
MKINNEMLQVETEKAAPIKYAVERSQEISQA